MGEQKTNKKRIVLVSFIVGFMVLVCIGLYLLGTYQTNKECKERLAKVQAGYMGNYNMISVKELLEYVWKNGSWDSYDTDDMHIVEYSEDEKNKIQFSVVDENNSFEVVHIKEDSKIIEDSAPAKTCLDNLYREYGQAYPERGILVDFSSNNNTVEGNMEKINKIKVLTLKDKNWDISDYLEGTINEIANQVNLQVYILDNGSSLANDSNTLLIELDELGKITLIQMEGEPDVAPRIYGLTIGEDGSNLSNLEKQGFMVISKIPDQDGVGTVTVELWKQETGNALSYTYTTSSNKISKIIYQTNVVDTELQNKLLLRSKVNVNACVDMVKEYRIKEQKVSTLVQSLFEKKGSWNGVMQEDESVEVTYDASASSEKANYTLRVKFLVELDGTIQYLGGEGIYKDSQKDSEKNLETENQMNSFIDSVLDAITIKLPEAGFYDWYSDSYFVSSCELTVVEGTENTYYVQAYDSEGFNVTFYDNQKCTLEQADGAWNCSWEYDGSNITIYTNQGSLYLYKK